ncbi:MAG: glycosyltransferase [Nitrospira sp.]|nr:MAG: glycosyltransferase [Nitrospira sp.]
MKIIFLIRSLGYGGAERQLILLAKGLHARRHDVVVSVFYSGGPLEKELRDAGIRIRPLNKTGRWDVPGFLFRMAKVLREERPEIVHGYLPDPNLVTAVLKPFFPAIKIVWGVRSARLDWQQCDWLARANFKLSCRLSGLADAIIANSHAGRAYHITSGYPAEKMLVIPNGIDTERFRPAPTLRERTRSAWGISTGESLIGLVGRLDPQKDHPNFLRAASLVARRRERVRFVCVGDGPDEYRMRLQALARSEGLDGRLLWMPNPPDMPAVYNALDVTVSCSFGEGLPNVVGEAMACGVPCVVTDVGDSAWVVGDVGEVVPPRNPLALAKAIEKVLAEGRGDSSAIRSRVMAHLSVDRLVADTERVLKDVYQQPRPSVWGWMHPRSAS